MTIAYTIIAGYWFSAVALWLFAWRAWYIYRSEHEHVFRYIAEGTALIGLADFLYGAVHLPAGSRILTGEFFTADAALIFGAFFALQFPVYYWGRVLGRPGLRLTMQMGLFLFASLAMLANLIALLMGARPLVMLTSAGTIQDGAPPWFNLIKVVMLIGLGLGAGLTFFYQGMIDHARRQQRLGLGILLAGLSGSFLTVVNQQVFNYIGIAVLALAVGLIIVGLFTTSAASASVAKPAG